MRGRKNVLIKPILLTFSFEVRKDESVYDLVMVAVVVVTMRTIERLESRTQYSARSETSL